ncbi:MAG TPA: hypothetical protein PKJ74_07175 [Chitinophagales bacterium]|nr:hypothetical protein [Chitinophagales bacterium]
MDKLNELKLNNEKLRGMIRNKINDILKEYGKKKNTIPIMIDKLKEFMNGDEIDSCIINSSSIIEKRGAKKKFTDDEARERKKLANNSESARIKRREYARLRRTKNRIEKKCSIEKN